jgi:hypothetical protein
MTRFALIAALALSMFAGGTSSFAGTDGISAGKGEPTTFERSKPRVPRGSGCDDPRDVIEHPECTPRK